MCSCLADVELPLGSFDDAVLKVVHHFKSALSKLACSLRLLNWDLIRFSLKIERLNWAYNGRGACAECLVNALLFGSLNHFVDLKRFHRHLKLLHLLKQRQKRLSGDARKNGSIQRWRNKLVFTLLVLPKAEEVHGAHLGDVVVNKPKRLIAPEILVAKALGFERRRVVTDKLVETVTYPPTFLSPNPSGHALITLVSQYSLTGTNPLG